MQPGEERVDRILSRPLQYLKGAGPHRAELLRLGLHQVKDILFYFPRDYLDLTDYRQISELQEGKVQSVEGVVQAVELRLLPGGRTLVS